MHQYSILSLEAESIDAIVENIVDQHRNNVADCFLFMMAIAPKGTPPVDLVDPLCSTYIEYKRRLDAVGIKNGVLIQSSIGHEYYRNSSDSFQHYVNLVDGHTTNTCCPMDEGFLEYLGSAVKKIAQAHPYMIMLDDDFRLMARRGKGCCCPLHLNHISKKIGKCLTREDVFAAMNGCSKEDDTIAEKFIESQRTALLTAARTIRKKIDEVDPTIIGAYCTCGNGAEFANDILDVMAGNNRPKIIRINNGYYCHESAHHISSVSYRAAAQKQQIKDHNDIVLLAETDTCPHYRYSTDASMLNTQYILSILEGAIGAKHWITSLNGYEKTSGAAYKSVLSRNSRIYEGLATAVKDVVWQGCRIPIPRDHYYYRYPESSDAWYSYVFERIGVPVYFSSDDSGVVFLAEFDHRTFSNEQLLNMFKNGIVLTANAVREMNKAGFSEYTGVCVEPYDSHNDEYEKRIGSSVRIQLQREMSRITANGNNEIEVLSWCYCLDKDGSEKITVPGLVRFLNPFGKYTYVYAGTPKTDFRFSEAFSFLCPERKKQICEILAEAYELPVVYEGDADVYLHCGLLKSGGYLCVFTNLSYDRLDKLPVGVSNEITKVQILNENGVFDDCRFEPGGTHVLLAVDLMPLSTVIVKVFF